MQHVYLFVKKDFRYNLATTNFGENMYNLPQYNTDISLWKGIDNTVEFSIRNRDRKGFHLRDNNVIFNLINHNNHTVFSKKLWCKDGYKGLYELKISENEIRDFMIGSYHANVVAENPEGEKTYLYNGEEWNPVFKVHIKNEFENSYKPSIILNPETFLHNYYHKDGFKIDFYTSSRIKADETSSHTASITLKDNFKGTIIMEGSSDVNPDNTDRDWFVIKEKTIESEKDETILFNEQLNCLWVRFKYIYSSLNKGKISEIVYRN